MTRCAINPCVLVFVRTDTCCSAKCVVNDHSTSGSCVLVAAACYDVVVQLQYTRYFLLCYRILYPDNGMTEAQQREGLEVL